VTKDLLISRRAALKGSLAFTLTSAALPSAAASNDLSTVIDAGKSGHPISDYMYGGFIEHIANLINYSFWSEVLDDRKFYHAVDSKPLPQPEGFTRRMMPQPNKWVPVGPDSDVTMDETAPYVGTHSPVVHLAGASARGIAQSGLSLARKRYTGRIVVAADPAAELSATLIWGAGADERQTVRLPAGQYWSTVPLTFTCPADTTEGRLEIVGKGTGTFRIGAASLMPADNIRGFRADTLALIKEMNCRMLRMPGGNLSAMACRAAQ
jgi:alpha-N-arabinofuranosidase